MTDQSLVERGRRLEYITVGWNLLEGAIAVGSGIAAGSISLLGFGFDSFIEVTSGAALVWRMSGGAADRERREARALRVVSACFLALAIYVAAEAATDLWSRKVSAASPVGIVLAAASLVVMPLLSRAKHRIARALGSRAMHADARQTDFCAYLSAILLGGLILNAALGFWWADPLAGLLMTPIIAREGVAALRGHRCAE